MAWNAKCALHLHTLWRETLQSVGACADRRTNTSTYTRASCVHRDWGLWVTKVRDDGKSENVRSLDIAHAAAAEGLACVGGDAKPPRMLRAPL